MSLVFDLAQGWSKGLRLAFEDTAASQLMNLDETCHVKQVHGNRVLPLPHQNLQYGGLVGEADGLWARGAAFKNSKRKLLVKTADCAPLIYVDVKSETVAIVHAGWRGLAQGIHLKVFADKICDPLSTWVWLGPHLEGETFEVRADLTEKFPRHLNDLNIFKPAPTAGAHYFYPTKLIERDFAELGVELLYDVGVDTFREQNFSSYRRARNCEGLPKNPYQNHSWIAFV